MNHVFDCKANARFSCVCSHVVDKFSVAAFALFIRMTSMASQNVGGRNGVVLISQLMKKKMITELRINRRISLKSPAWNQFLEQWQQQRHSLHGFKSHEFAIQFNLSHRNDGYTKSTEFRAKIRGARLWIIFMIIHLCKWNSSKFARFVCIISNKTGESLMGGKHIEIDLFLNYLFICIDMA